ncbi:MAG: MFS transporter [Betaproteobacteria bacterium]|nr:MFS transporter [Betaproteobacteria bacterium]
MSASAASAPRVPAFAALRHPGFRAYFLTSALAMMADSIEHVISYWIIYQKFHSPTLGGIAVLTHWLPFLFFSVYSGAAADRFDPRRIIQLGMVLFMLVSAAWGVLFLTDTLEIWHAAVLLTLHGFAGVLWLPASQLLVHDIVGPAQLQSAVRLNATSRQLGILLGPAIGGVLMLAFGPAWGILVNVLIYIPLVWWLWKAPYGARAAGRTPHAKPQTLGGLADIVAVAREVAHNRTIASMILLAGGASFFVGNAYQAQMPEFATDLGHGHAGLGYSLLLSADAAGALMAGVALESRGLLRAHPRTAFILTILWCLCIGGFAAAQSYPLALALLFAAGFFNLAFNAMAQTLVQLHAPEPIRGRVIGLYGMSALGLRAFSGITVGMLGSLIGIHWSLAGSALALLAATAVLLGLTTRIRPQ